jgi:hypothetical protein
VPLTVLPFPPWPFYLDPPRRPRCADCRAPFEPGRAPRDGLCPSCRGRRARAVARAAGRGP